MFLIFTNDEYPLLAANRTTLQTDFLYGSLDFHKNALAFLTRRGLVHLVVLVPVDYSPFRQIVGSHLNLYPIPWQYANAVHAHLAREVTQNLMAVHKF